MARISSILGLNARNHLFQSKYNSKRGKEIADSKLETKKFLEKHNIATPKLFGVFSSPEDVARFDWGLLSDNFVIKPAEGYAGSGIIIIRKRISGDEFLTINKQKIGIDDLKLHALDILEGHYSIHSIPDLGFIEERIPIHPAFRRYTFQGTPDVRVMVFNKIPIMAMLRLPTAESAGKANLHQGAIGAGIDLATGRTTNAIINDSVIKLIPGKNLRISGLQIPFWNEILISAVNIQKKLGKLNYMAVDFVIDNQKGPMVLELTARPGLRIQLANTAGLKRRLERIEGLEVEDAEKAVRIAKDLFAVRQKTKKREVLKIFETIEVVGSDKKRHKLDAKIDTGAFRTSIDRQTAKKLGLLAKRNILWRDFYRSALGREERSIIDLSIWLGGKKIKTTASVADRSNLKTKIIIGRRDLTGFILRP